MKFSLKCISIIVVLLGPVASAQIERRPRSFEVFDAVLDSLYHSQGDTGSTVVVADSLYWRQEGIIVRGKFVAPHRSVIRLSTIDNFESVSSRSVPFPQEYRYRKPLHVFSADEYERLLARAKSIQENTPPRELKEMPYWLAFAERFPQAWGLTVLSRVGFSADSSEALIQVRHQCGGGCFSSEVILLDRLKTGWKIVERMNLGSSERLGIGSMRYLGPGAHFIAQIKRAQDSTRRAVHDSIERDKAPRRIRGTVYNRLTGKPLPNAQIFVRSMGGWTRRVVADRRGSYQVNDPPIGGTMLEVQCPGAQHRLGATLDAPGLYVFPALDTVIDVGPPNIEPCWFPRRPHTIVSGELESRLSNPPPHPSADAAGVYAAVLRELRKDTTHIVVKSETVAWCDWNYDCPKLSIAHLINSGAIDTSTLDHFKRVRQDTVALSPAPMAALGMPLFFEGQRAYVEREATRASEFYPDTLHPITFWSLLRDLYKADTIISFTSVGFNTANDQAIVAVRIHSEEDDDGETLLLHRINGRWTILLRHLENERPSGAFVSNNCVAVSRPSQLLPDLRIVPGDYDFNLVSSSTNNRNIPWRMRFTDSSATMLFEVLTPSSGERRSDLEPGTYISAGKQYFQNATGLLQFDGFGYSIVVDRVEADRLFGRWEHYSFGIPTDEKTGKAVPEPAGHFCALRRRDKAPRPRMK